MEKNQNEWYEPILAKFRLKPEFVESFGKAKKVVTKNGVFALKQITHKNPFQFFNLSRQLYKKGFTKITPVYYTIDNKPYVYYRNQYYYLMPWYERNVYLEKHDHKERMLRELARLHDVSAKNVLNQKEKMAKTYENLLSEWERKTLFLEEYMDKCEKKWYLSPFELQYCMIFHEIMQAIDFSKNKLKEWYELGSEKKGIRIVVNHGNVSNGHFVYDKHDNGMFISFEHAQYTLPIYDLIRYYHKVLRTYPIQCDECKDWFFYYQKYFPYTEEERALFFSYLVFPDNLYRTVKKYVMDNDQTEQQAVSGLQKRYWQMKNIEYVVIKIQEEEQKIAEQKEGASS